MGTFFPNNLGSYNVSVLTFEGVDFNHRTSMLGLTGGFKVSSLTGAGFACAVEANLIIDPFRKVRHTRIDIERFVSALASSGDADLYVLICRGTVKQQRDTRI